MKSWEVRAREAAGSKIDAPLALDVTDERGEAYRLWAVDERDAALTLTDAPRVGIEEAVAALDSNGASRVFLDAERAREAISAFELPLGQSEKADALRTVEAALEKCGCARFVVDPTTLYRFVHPVVDMASLRTAAEYLDEKAECGQPMEGVTEGSVWCQVDIAVWEKRFDEEGMVLEARMELDDKGELVGRGKVLDSAGLECGQWSDRFDAQDIDRSLMRAERSAQRACVESAVNVRYGELSALREQIERLEAEIGSLEAKLGPSLDASKVMDVVELRQKMGAERFDAYLTAALDKVVPADPRNGGDRVVDASDPWGIDREQMVVDALAKVEEAIARRGTLPSADDVMLEVQYQIWHNTYELSQFEHELALCDEIAEAFCREMEKEYPIDQVDEVREELGPHDWREYVVAEQEMFVLDFGVDQIMDDARLHVNVILQTPGETFGYREDFTYELNEEVGNRTLSGSPIEVDGSLAEAIESSSMAWLTQQQGHSLAELYDEKAHSPYLDSMRSELNEMNGAFSTVTVLAEVDLDGYLEMAYDRSQNWEVGKDAVVGLFDQNNGAGGVLEVELERPVVVSPDMFQSVQLEGSRNGGYTVDETYGLVPDAWKDCMRRTDERPFRGVVADWNAAPNRAPAPTAPDRTPQRRKPPTAGCVRIASTPSEERAQLRCAPVQAQARGGQAHGQRR